MRNMNCENIRREIEEAGSAGFLSAAALSHLETCAACQTLSRQQTNLQAILSGLGTVEAPGDFDFRLRARLAGEKRMGALSLPFGNLSFGLRSTAVAAILLLIGSAVLFVALKPGPNTSVAGGNNAVPKPLAPQAGSENPTATNNPGSTEVAKAPANNEKRPIEQNQLTVRHAPKATGMRREVASNRIGNRFGARDMGQTGAQVLTRDQLAGTYPTAAFPIDASYQSLKVSVDDSRGASRTISLPSVSFGSQRTLSQSASPLLASARDTW
ncbi:MAG TPA: hypothetical protein VE977_15565 [Pyrinomonadaceae bacterium]|nr:hypothetical protein [Pyrinomonadaceae bacterium]